jgi:GT2 family glycosyltransferase
MDKISFVINTAVNELEYVKLLLNSLQKNLDHDHHEIIVFVDSDNQGTYEYLKSIKNSFEDLKIVTHKLPPCIGYSRNNNLLVEIAKHDIVSYLQSDMVISPGYDTDVLKLVQPNRILCATRVEPPLHGPSNMVITENFGLKPSEFNLDKWNEYSVNIKQDSQLNYFFAPITFYKQTWLDLGGYDTLFRRSREDTDFVQKCFHNDIELLQTFSAVVYHFTCTSSRGSDWFNQNNAEAQSRVQLQQQADRIELNRFIRKWGNFSHDVKLTKFDIDLIITNSTKMPADIISTIEPFVSRVYLDNHKLIEYLIDAHSSDHIPANQLLKFTDEQWEMSKQFYNQVDFSKIYLYYDQHPINSSITIRIDGTTLTNEDINLFQHLHLVIEENETGEYKFYNMDISILSKNECVERKTQNPKFNMDLLNIE